MSNSTQIIVPTQGIANTVEGLWTADQLKSMYAAHITGLASMTATFTDAVGAEGTVRTVTFNPPTGNKG